MSVLPHAWVDGRLVDASSAAIGLSDHGFVVGDGVFEMLKVVRGRPFAARRHVARLAVSASGLGLPPFSAATVGDAMDAVISANALGNMTGAALRVTYTFGRGPLGSARHGAGTGSLVVAAAPPAGPLPSAAAVCVVPWVRNERGALAGLKTTSYAENVRALAHAHALGADEAIFANTVGDLCEGTGTNVFLAVGGRLVTPPLSSGCLAGVTRGLLLESGVATEEAVPVGALGGAPEAFLSSTLRDVQPIGSVDGRPLGACPGPLTSAAAAAFADLVERSLDP